ncbi:MAG: hypothetical protein HQ553_09745 [Chloroflexi bacterium]|nr:hypothetical protein [Chloroflexota bacterium]
MKLFKKKTPKRTVFGFPCDNSLAQMTRLTAKAIEFPIYVLAEHALQIGLAEIMPLLNHEDERADLEHHLRADHLLPPHLGQPITDYDERLISERKESIMQKIIEKEKSKEDVVDAARHLIVVAKFAGIEPKHLIGFIQQILIQNKFPGYRSYPHSQSHINNYDTAEEEESYEEEEEEYDDEYAPEG